MATNCDYCDKDNHHDDVDCMVSSKNGAAICDKCVEICMEIVEEYREEQLAQPNKQD